MNHLGDTNKMVETPRTDAVWELFATDTTLEPDVEFSTLARTLERELNAANQRIKRLEEAGDEMASILNNTRKDWYTSDQCEVSAFNWNKAKEAKL